MTHYPDHEYLSIEALLDETRWMRVLARTLVRDEHAAEDVAQDLWVAALERPPTHRWNVRQWAKGVARNLARQHVRREERRARRERAAARGEALPSTEALVERAVVQRALVDAVLDLAEPYRSTILLRYFEEARPRTIARQQEIPVETVRTRLKRALEQLRTRLDTEFGGDRRAWCLPLLLLPAGTGSAASLAGGSASVLGGGPGSLVAKIAVLAAGVLGAVGVGTILLRSVPENAPRSDSETPRAVRTGRLDRDATPGAKAGTAPRELDGKERRVSNVETDGARPLPVRRNVSGTVSDAFGNPLTGARVVAFQTLAAYEGSRATAASLEALAETRTGEDGAFRVGPVRGWVLIEAACPGHARARVLTREGSRLEIRLDRPGSLRGRILAAGPDGPGVRATVVLFGKGSTLNFYSFGENGEAHVQSMVTAYASTRTDGRGEYAFNDLAPGDYRVSVLPRSGPRIRLARRAVRVRAGEQTLRDVVLPPRPRTRVVGRVVDGESGRPVAGARLRVQENPGQRVLSDKNGAFAFAGLRAAPRQVHVFRKGYADVTVRIHPAFDVERVERIVLDRLAPVRGRVVDATGRGVEGAVVSRFARGADDPMRRGPATRTRADGSFTLPGVRPGPNQRFFAIAEGHAGGASPPVSLRPGTGLDGVVIRLTSGGSIDGHVRLPDSARIPVALQTVSGSDREAPDYWPSELVSPVRTDPSGRFLFRHVPPGLYRFTAWIGSQFHTFGRPVRVENGARVTADFDLERGSPLEGRILDVGGRPVPWVTVRLLPREPGRPSDSAASDAAGEFRFIGVGPGPHALAVDSQGRFFDREIRNVRPGREPVVIRLERKPAFGGRVIRASTGAPARSFWIRAHPHDRGAESVSVKRYFHDPHGRFELTALQTVLGPPALPGGVYDVEAGTDEGAISSLLSGVSLQRRESDRFLELRLEPGGFLRGLVRSPGGEAIAGARVVVTRVGSPTTAWRVTGSSDARGRFAIGPVRAETLRLRFFHQDWSPCHHVARATRGGATRMDVALAPGGAIRVTAGDGRGRRIKAVSLTLRANEPGLVVPDGRPGAGAETDANGRFTFRGLRPGSYAVSAELPGEGEVARADVQVRPGRTADVALRIVKEAENTPARR